MWVNVKFVAKPLKGVLIDSVNACSLYEEAISDATSRFVESLILGLSSLESLILTQDERSKTRFMNYLYDEQSIEYAYPQMLMSL